MKSFPSICKVKTQVMLKFHVLGPVLLNIKIKLQKENLLPVLMSP